MVIAFQQKCRLIHSTYTVQFRILNTTNKYHLLSVVYTLPHFPCIKDDLDLTGLGCATVMFPEAAALCAAQILALNDHVIWSNVRAKQLNTWIGLKEADKKSRNDK